MSAGAIAALLGTVIFRVGAGRNVAPPSGDPEYGPMVVALLVALNGLATLAAFARAPSVRASR